MKDSTVCLYVVLSFMSVYCKQNSAGRPAQLQQEDVTTPVVGVLDTYSQLMAVLELLLKGRLHSLRMQHCSTKKG